MIGEPHTRDDTPNSPAPLPRRTIALGAVALAAQALAALAFVGVNQLAASRAAYMVFAVVMGLAWAVAIMAFRPANDARALVVIAVFAVLTRAILIFGEPRLSDDVYRYMWDGNVLRHGLNPYGTPPDDTGADFLRGPWDNRIAHRDVRTVYPPLAQVLFAITGAAADSPRAFQAQAAVFDLACAVLIGAWLRARKRPMGAAVIWSASPIALIEFAGHGHLDAAGIACLVAALFALETRRERIAGIALAAGVLVKFYPLAFAPLLFRRMTNRRLALLGLVALPLAYLPFLSAGSDLWAGLFRYAGAWAFNGSMYDVLLHGTNNALATKLAIGAMFCAVIAWTALGSRDVAEAGAALGLAWILLTPTAHPWYLAWALVFAPLASRGPVRLSLLWLGATMPLAHLASISYRAGGAFELPAVVRVVEYAPVVALLLWSVAKKFRARQRDGGTRTAAA